MAHNVGGQLISTILVHTFILKNSTFLQSKHSHTHNTHLQLMQSSSTEAPAQIPVQSTDVSPNMWWQTDHHLSSPAHFYWQICHEHRGPTPCIIVLMLNNHSNGCSSLTGCIPHQVHNPILEKQWLAKITYIKQKESDPMMMTINPAFFPLMALWCQPCGESESPHTRLVTRFDTFCMAEGMYQDTGVKCMCIIRGIQSSQLSLNSVMGYVYQR